MKMKIVVTVAAAVAGLAILGGAATSAEDNYRLKVPGGLAFSEFRGYEDWAVVSVHHTDDLIKVVVGNRAAMNASGGHSR